MSKERLTGHPHILVCFALKDEARPFTAPTATLRPVKVLVTGMGRRNAAGQFKQALSEGLPALVITSGFAGGLKPELATGTVVFDADATSGLETPLLKAGAAPARFHCSDRVAVTAAEKTELLRRTGADAVEMESESIRSLCAGRGIPSATVRVILDTAAEDLLLDFNALMTADMRMDNRKLALAIARAPQLIPALLRMQKQTRAAAEKLAETLRAALSGWQGQ